MREDSKRLLIYGAMLFVCLLVIVGWKTWTGLSDVPTVPASQTVDGDLESMPEVQFATRGGWLAASGVWSRFGVLGAAFDGERIVMNSAESAQGSLSCWISPRGRPMLGACYETGDSALSSLPAGRSCTWHIVVYAISKDTVQGARALKPGESDPGCVAEYGSLPSTFMWQRPRGQPVRYSY